MLRKTTKTTALAFVCAVLISSCAAGVAGNSGKVPPGQAKKITGSKSAKPYAPGQQKKKK